MADSYKWQQKILFRPQCKEYLMVPFDKTYFNRLESLVVSNKLFEFYINKTISTFKTERQPDERIADLRCRNSTTSKGTSHRTGTSPTAFSSAFYKCKKHC